MKRIAAVIAIIVFFFIGIGHAELTELSVNEAVTTLDKTKLRVHFIDVGTGLAIFIQTPNDRKNIFIDGGKEAGEKIIDYVDHFHPKNSNIDLALVTHPDNDHFYGMMKIFDSYAVKEFWYSGYDNEALTPTGYWKKKFLENRVQVEEGCTIKIPLNNWNQVGDVVVIDDAYTFNDSDDVKVSLLNTDSQPPERDPISNRRFDESLIRNNASLVFKFIFKDISFLITGDINGRDLETSNEGKGLYECDSEELELVSRHLYAGNQFNLQSTVLQVPHHGSSGASSMAFLKAINPEYAVIAAGFGHGHPTAEALFRLKEAGISESKTFRTDDGETEDTEDAILDDSFVFETDGLSINRIFRVRME